jgi:hypothetical protein
MNRRRFLALGAAASGAVALGGLGRLGWRPAAAQLAPSVPTVDRLVLTNVVDNFYDVFAKAGKLDTITVQRTRSARRRRSLPSTAWPTTWNPRRALSGGRSCSTSA